MGGEAPGAVLGTGSPSLYYATGQRLLGERLTMVKGWCFSNLYLKSKGLQQAQKLGKAGLGEMPGLGCCLIWGLSYVRAVRYGVPSCLEVLPGLEWLPVPA